MVYTQLHSTAVFMHILSYLSNSIVLYFKSMYRRPHALIPLHLLLTKSTRECQGRNHLPRKLSRKPTTKCRRRAAKGTREAAGASRPNRGTSAKRSASFGGGIGSSRRPSKVTRNPGWGAEGGAPCRLCLSPPLSCSCRAAEQRAELVNPGSKVLEKNIKQANELGEQGARSRRIFHTPGVT
jgi:hypothetical protein